MKESKNKQWDKEIEKNERINNERINNERINNERMK